MNASVPRVLFLLALVTACSKAPEPAPAATPITPAPAATPITPAPAHATAAAPAASGVITGPVLETMNAASYTYVRVHGESGDIWAAAPEFRAKIGEQVRVALEMPMVNFHSTSLNRDFPVLYFVTQITPADAPVANDMAAAAPPPGGVDPHGSLRAPLPSVTTPMAPPAGGMTIANLWTHRKVLAGKTVTVHGVVVKYNAGILGQTWIHLQDGTGTAADGSNDITVTSSEDVSAKPGDTVVATGAAAIDRNIGSGYSYPVIIEHARITAVNKTAGS